MGHNVNISDYGKSISVECTDEDLSKLRKIQEAFDKCMENSQKTKEELLRQAMTGPKLI